ncbi:hypothetical protein ACNKHL_01080 [Shigella flexneri]
MGRDFAIIGGMTRSPSVLDLVRAHVMVGGCSGVAQDVPPYVIRRVTTRRRCGVNIEGLKRRGFRP